MTRVAICAVAPAFSIGSRSLGTRFHCDRTSQRGQVRRLGPFFDPQPPRICANAQGVEGGCSCIGSPP